MTQPTEETLLKLHSELISERFWRKLIIWVVVGGVVILLTAISIWSAILYSQGQKLDKSNDILIDCTVKTGKCYQDAQENTRKAVEEIINSINNKEQEPNSNAVAN